MIAVRPVVIAALQEGDDQVFRSKGGQDTFYQDSLERITAPTFLPPLVMGPTAYAREILSQAAEIDVYPEDVLLFDEPQSDGAFVQAAALWALGRAEGVNMALLICPPGHEVDDLNAFERAVGEAAQASFFRYLVCMGAVIDDPEIECPKIKVGERLHAEYPGHFVEWLRAHADEGTQEGCVWHTGMVCAMAGSLLDVLPDPEGEAARALRKAKKETDFYRLNKPTGQASLLEALMSAPKKLAVQSLFTGWKAL